jgi:hypothetical protein
MARQLVHRLRTLWALGPINVLRVGIYRVGLRTGLHPVLHLRGDIPAGPFFLHHRPAPTGAIASTAWQTQSLYFSHHRFALEGTPDWHANPFKPGARARADLPWHQLPDFDPALGDIKTVWEASRMDWLVAMAQRAAVGDAQELARLNAWLADWANANPPYFGVNWKCGQEASIRILHLAMAAMILGHTGECAPGLRAFVALHARRIAPTLGYAMGQSNNHGTSEAAALFIAGTWLGGAEGKRWANAGRRWLEDRARHLIAADGTFSQYSMSYHRLMLDTYSIAECWRHQQHLPPFSPRLYAKLAAATHWLHAWVQPHHGDAPNLGANDGANLLALTDAAYRDFRPSLQLAAALFLKSRAVEATGLWDQPALWLGVAPATQTLPPAPGQSYAQGGLHLLKRQGVFALLRYPQFRFRPSQSDLLHLDLWVQGRNLLSDGGSYSYADPLHAYFSGTASHNTVMFDARDQMPRLGKFLFACWPKPRQLQPVQQHADHSEAAAAYRDAAGNTHVRQLRLSNGRLQCTDVLAGPARTAVLRWRLTPGAWEQQGDAWVLGNVTLRVHASTPLKVTRTEGWQSLHYLQCTPVPVLEIETTLPATLHTEITF